MKGRVFFPLYLVFAALAVDSAARADIMQFTPDRDNTLYEHASADLSNGSGDQIFFGRTGPNADSVVRRALVRFDVSALPGDVVIDSVELSLTIDMAPFQFPTGGTASLHRVVTDWGEGASHAPGVEGGGTVPQSPDATWDHSMFDTEFWAQPGGDYLPDASASVGYGMSTETIIFTTTDALKRDIRKWSTQPSQNFGWIVIGNEGVDHTARRVDSRENTESEEPPLLTVEYHIAGPADKLGLEPVASGLNDAVVVTNAGDGSQRLFIVEQEGVIRILDLATGSLLPTPFLDISGLVDDTGGEQGLLGLAFHPDYASNGQFYVNYTYDTNPPNGPDRTRIAMYQASIGNPNIADTLETVLMEFEQDFANHNGGDMHFDPEGYLVIASGDGGSGNDPNNRAQDLGELLGKMLRIDVDTVGGDEKCGIVGNYGIPPGNPFTGAADGCDEILHYGMRNPWRFSFDARTGELFIGDVGQNDWEEVSWAPAGASGLNFGWKICEGLHIRNSETELCDFGTLPIIEYPRSGGNCAVTGGFVYRGGIGSLQGRYVYADYCSARIWIATRDGDEWTSEEWIESPALGLIPTFGQDETCELYVVNRSNSTLYRIVDSEDIDQSGFEELRCR